MSRPLSLTLAALGGQGGGVVTSWLAAVARRERYLVQATSVPGVAQRTGATLYYLEFFPEADVPAGGREPIMALMPSPGDVDIVVAAELVEAGRAMQRGLVTPDRTTLVTSTHRAYTISEKSATRDGRADSEAILEEAERLSRRLVAFDMAAVAAEHGAIISAALLGAIAAGANLPFAVDSYRRVIHTGDSGAANLAAFNASYERASGRMTVAPAHGPSAPALSLPSAVEERIQRNYPGAARSVLRLGAGRLIEYQDVAYANEYLDRMEAIAALEPPDRDDTRLTNEVARGLALWMAFEDTIRVAQLKLRPERLAEIRRAVKAKPGQLVEVTEFLRPRAEEICGTLPEGIGRSLLHSRRGRALVERFSRERRVRTTTVAGFLMLRAVAALRRWRRGTLRFAEERRRIDGWLAQIRGVGRFDYDLAVELAECHKLVRGYGDTHARGVEHLRAITHIAQQLTGRTGVAAIVARLRGAAEADDSGVAVAREMQVLGLSLPPPAVAQGG
jgi:indolepyruvate ferredoxin oxidoreductase beta subunit